MIGCDEYAIITIKTIRIKYKPEVSILVEANIALACSIGPYKIQDENIAIKLPKIYWDTNGIGLPSKSWENLKKLPIDKKKPSKVKTIHPYNLWTQDTFGK